MNVFAGTALLVWMLAGQVATTESPAADDIERAVRQLSDPDFATRQAATVLLWETGRAAESALRRAVRSQDREVAFRAGQILDKFRHGIFADTPADIVRLINQYLEGDERIRLEIMNQLQQRNSVETMLALIDSEENEEFREKLTAQILRDVEKVVPALVLDKQYDRVERLLELGSVSDEGMTLYLSYLVLRGLADDKIAELRARERPGGLDASDARLLAYLLRATGDLTAGREAAESAGEQSLLKSILFDQGDWKALAKLEDDPTEVARLSSYQLIERLGFIAAYHRLAGNDERFEATLQRIRDAADNDALRWYIGEALLINGRFEDGIEQMKLANQAAAFRLLMAQARYRDAFALIGLGATPEDRDLWFFQVVQDAKSTDRQQRERFEIGLQAARAFVRVGLNNDAKRYFADLGEAVKGDEDGHRQRLRTLIGVETKSGIRDLALEHTMFALGVTNNAYPLGAAYPEHFDAASIWWDFLSAEFPSENRLDTLRRIDRLVLGIGDKPSADEMMSLADAAERYGAGLETSRRGKLLFEMANAMLRHGHADAAEARLVKAAEFSPDAAMKLGDSMAGREQWQEAATWYGRAWEQDKTQFAALFLQGKALGKAGDAKAGDPLVELSALLPLSPQARRTFALAIQERGYKSDAANQWRLLVRTGELHDWYTNDAAKQLGNTVSSTEPLRASDGWRRLLLSALKTSSAFTEVEGYLQLPQLIHKVRARAFLDAGNNESAFAELRESHAALPGGIKLAEDLFTKFDAAGMKAQIDPLFDETYALYEQLCEDYPDAATHHNNLAWLAARCDRKLEPALEHANRAVALAPDSMAYLDTLAEVHFRRGNAEEAIRLETICLDREPNNKDFIRQLKRFRGEPVREDEETDEP